jgi:lipopolysaccharide exporter
METEQASNHRAPRTFPSQNIASREGFGVNIRKLITGTSLAQIIGLSFAPLLTRLYTPEQFGLLALFVSIGAFLSLAASLNYEFGIMLPDDQNEAWTLAVLCVLMVIMSSFISFFPLGLFRNRIAEILGSPALAPYLLWIPPAIFFLSINRISENWLSRWVKYTELAGTKVAGAASGALTKTGLGMLPHMGAGGLVTGSIACEAGKVLWAAPALYKIKSQVHFSFSKWKAVLSAQKNFPRYSFGASLLEFAGYALPIYFIAHTFGPKILGFYDLGLRMVAAPLELVVNGVRQVFYQKSVFDFRDRGDIAAIVEKTSSRLIGLGFVPFLVLGFTGRYLFSFIFGAEWDRAGLFAQILSPALFLRFVASPTLIFNTLRKQKIYLIWQIINFILICLALFIAHKIESDLLTVTILSICTCLTHMLLIFLNLKLSGASIRRILALGPRK